MNPLEHYPAMPAPMWETASQLTKADAAAIRASIATNVAAAIGSYFTAPEGIQ